MLRRSWRCMNRRSRKPWVAMNATKAPLRSSTALVATVEPWPRSSMRARSMPDSVSALNAPMSGDLVAVEGGRIIVTKVPSTPRSPDIGAFNALTESGIDLARIEDLGHGSTVATNAVLERKGASVAFIATQGFRDLLFMQRHDRRNIYDLFYAKPAPPVRRKDCFEAAERLRADGTMETPLDESKVRAELLPVLKAGGYRAVAICLLNAYANPVHEKRLAALIAEALPDLLVTCSHQVAREFREYERASTTLLSAYVQPVIDGYLHRFENRLADAGRRPPLDCMTVKRPVWSARRA